MEIKRNEWERVNFDTKRLMVPGGWLVRTEKYVYEGDNCETPVIGSNVTETFVADPKHEWRLKDEND